MSKARDGYHAALDESTLYIQVVGPGSMYNVAHLDVFASSEIEHGVRQVYIDLSRCTSMDSTFMGTMVGILNRLQAHKGRMAVINPSGLNHRLLTMLGINTVIPILTEQKVPELQFAQVGQVGTQTFQKRLSFIKQAHENLVTLSDSNRQQFQAFLQSLETELAKPPKPEEPSKPGPVAVVSAKNPPPEKT